MLVAKPEALPISRNDGLLKTFQDDLELLLCGISDDPSFENLILPKTQKILNDKQAHESIGGHLYEVWYAPFFFENHSKSLILVGQSENTNNWEHDANKSQDNLNSSWGHEVDANDNDGNRLYLQNYE